jgi:hypothetical protein
MPELQLPPEVHFSLAGSTYSLLGTMRRVDGGWIDRSFVAPMNQTFFLRTRGLIGSSNSGGIDERTQRFFLDHEEGIFADSFD